MENWPGKQMQKYSSSISSDSSSCICKVEELVVVEVVVVYGMIL